MVCIELGPPPPPQASESTTLDPKGGEKHSLADEGVGYPIGTTGQKAWHAVYSVVDRVSFF